LRGLRESWLRREEARWSRIEKGDCDSIADFVHDYPGGPHAALLPRFQEACRWRDAQFAAPGDLPRVIVNMKEYLEEAPLLEHEKEARQRMEDAYWAMVTQQLPAPAATVAMATAYLRDLPNGVHAAEARRLVRQYGGR
jgi:hypothetical protein